MTREDIEALLTQQMPGWRVVKIDPPEEQGSPQRVVVAPRSGAELGKTLTVQNGRLIGAQG